MHYLMRQFTLPILLLISSLVILEAAHAQDSRPGQRSVHQQLAFDIFKELIESDTTHSTGDTLAVAKRLAVRLKREGFPRADIHVIESAPGKGNLVVRLRGVPPAGQPPQKPLLLLAHLDVVEADPRDWSLDPMRLTDDGGYYYGRGTLDDKDEVAIHLANLIVLKRMLDRNALVLTRDVIGAFTADEEGGPDNGVQYLVANHRELVDAAFVLNEGGGGAIKDGVYLANSVQTAEKVYQSYTLETTNPGGHSSIPMVDNAIYELSQALLRIAAHEFPVLLNETTRAYFRASATTAEAASADMMRGILADPPAAASLEYFRGEPAINARLRTTCVATQLEAGHAENALPQRARATVNCRILPGIPVASVRQTLQQLVANPDLSVTPVKDALTSEASPLTEEVMRPIREITDSMWPGVIVVPTMSTGATDALFFRNAGIPVYGVSGIFHDIADIRAHGRDERILKKSFYEGLEFLYRLTRAYVTPQDSPASGPAL